MINILISKRAGVLAATILFFIIFGFVHSVFGQNPEVTTRFNNPVIDCNLETFCIDVEFQADSDSVQIFGINFRFLYEADVLDFKEFDDFVNGYGQGTAQPLVSYDGQEILDFDGDAIFFNKAVELIDPSVVYLISDTSWTYLFRMCFDLLDSDPFSSGDFYTSLVFDKKEDPSDGGIISPGGVVITVVNFDDPNVASAPADELVQQFNWDYTPGSAGPPIQPWGSPEQTDPTKEPNVDIAFNGVVSGFNSVFDYCYNDSVIVTLDSILGGVGPFTIGWEVVGESDLNDTLSNLNVGDELFGDLLDPGSYTINITLIEDSNGCQLSDLTGWSATVNVGAEPDVDIAFNGDISGFGSEFYYCFGETTIVTLSGINAGEAPFTIGWEVAEDASLSDTVSGLDLTNNELFSGILDPGTYNINITTITDANGCELNDPTGWSAVVIIENTPEIDNSGAQFACDSFNLPLITGTNLTGNEAYYDNSQANNGSVIMGPITSSMTVWIYDATAGGCSDEVSFAVTINTTPAVDVLQNVVACDSFELPVIIVGDYFTDSGGAGMQLNAGDFVTSSQTIYIYAETGTMPNCTDESSFEVTINTTPVVDVLQDVVACDSFELPVLTVGDYFTDSGGAGMQLSAGDFVTSSQTIYIYAETGTMPNCTDESSFEVTINTTPAVDVLQDVVACDSFELPVLTVGDYFTDSGGAGMQLNAGDFVTSSQTLYIYAETGTMPNCTDESSFDVTINTTPAVDVLQDVVACDSFELPVLTVGNYFTGSGGTGMQLNAGDFMTSSQTLYIYAETGTMPNCTDESSFDVTINTTPVVDVLQDVAACDSFELPGLMVGNYFTGSGGTGMQLNAGDFVTSTQTIYIYAETGTMPNCTDESSFEVTINTTPVVDVLQDVVVCDSFELPGLMVGNYFTGSGGTGMQLNAGDFVTSSQTLYIYAETGTMPNCTDESSFSVTIENTPSIDNPGPQIACGSFDLPEITGNNLSGNEAYFNDSQANSGTEIFGPITSSMTVWIFDQTNGGCSDEVSFAVTIDTIPMVSCPVDTSFCVDDGIVDLSSLTPAANPSGGTFSGPGVSGGDFDPDDAGIGIHITTYVFTDGNGCTDSCSFEIEVFDLPVVNCPDDIEDVFVGSDPFTLTGGTPLGGSYSGPGVSGGEFNPAAAMVGIHVITYTYEDAEGCQNTCTFTIEVVATPPVSCPANFDICFSADPIQLTGADPDGGDYSGPGVEINVFNPADAGVGVHVILYTAPSSDTCSFEIEVLALPIVECPADTSFCIDHGLVDLLTLSPMASPTGGSFSGQGVDGTIFNPEQAGSGAHVITYVFSDANNCTDSCTFEIEVFGLPELTCPADQEICIEDDVVDLTTLGASPSGGTFSGPGVSGGDFDLGDAGIGIHTITYSYTDGNGCENTCTFEIEVFGLPVVECPDDLEVCIDEDVVDLTTLGASPSGGTFSGEGVDGNEFDPSQAGVGVHTITYTYTDSNGCTNSCTFEIEVFGLPVVTCPADQEFCIDEDVVDLTTLGASPSGGTFSGEGVVGNEFDPSEAGVGVHTITYSYTDGNGCENTCSFEIEVFGLPVVECPDDITVCENADPFDLEGAEPADGDYSGNGVVNGEFDPGIAGLGEHTITYTFIDVNGCENSCTFAIAVIEDLTPPSITCPPTQIVDAEGACAVQIPDFTGLAIVSDNCSDPEDIVVNQIPAPGLTAIAETTNIFLIATDEVGNSSNCNFTLVLENFGEIPTLDCGDGLVEVDNDAGECGAEVEIQIDFVQDCEGGQEVVNSFTGGGLNADGFYPVGTTVVEFYLLDNGDTLSQCNVMVIVDDIEAPQITCPGNVTIATDAGECFATYSPAAATATDNCGIASITNNAPATFSVGDTTVVHTATDVNGNSESCQQVVTVQDNEAPQITCPDDVTVDTDAGECFATYSPAAASATDNCGVASISNNAPATFSVGITAVVHTVTDVNGNTATCEQVMTVQDNEAPQITCPNDVTVDTDAGECFATYIPAAATATDNCGIASITNNAPATFSVGNTTVVHTATDVNGNSVTCQQEVTVEDNESPVANCPSDVTISTVAEACFGSYTPPSFMVSDNCGVESISNDAPADFPPGSTTINYLIEDVNGNTESCQQTVTVEDTEDPVIACPADTSLEVASGETEVFVGLPDATAEDNCSIASIDNDFNGGADASGIYPVGITTVVYTATDGSGNTATCSTTITVTVDDELEQFFLSGNIATIFGVNISDVEVEMTGDDSGVDITAANGNFEIEVTQGSSVDLSPSKDIHWLDGVTTLDVVIIQQAILFIDTLSSPYQLIAADANADGFISTFDLVLLSNLIVGNLPNIPGNTSWRFIDADFEFDEPFDLTAQNWPEFISLSNVNQDMDSLDFVAIKTGDVSGDAGTGSRMVYDEMELVREWNQTTNEEYEMVIRPARELTTTGYQMEFNFNPSMVEEISIILESSELQNLSEYNYFIDADRGIARINWWNAAGQELNDQSELFRIQIKPRSGVEVGSDFVDLMDRGTLWYSEWYDTDANIYRLRLTDSETVAGEYVLHQNRPNPYRDYTSIMFELPEEMEVTLEILDVSGRMIRSTTLQGTRGLNQYHLEVSDLPTGVNYYRLLTDEWSATRTMIKIE